MAGPLREPEREPTPLATETVRTTPADDVRVVEHDDVRVVEHDPVPTQDRQSVYDRERAEYGGIKFGSAFFGWLTATGLIVLLSAVAAAITAAFGIEADPENIDFGAALAAAIVLLVILFVSYLAGGYVAGRMARFAGMKQGFAVWLWGVAVTIVLVVVGAIAGSQFDVLNRAGLLPDIGFGPDDMLATVLTIAGAAVAALLGAILGGIAGMRFHRRVDRAGWTQQLSS